MGIEELVKLNDRIFDEINSNLTMLGAVLDNKCKDVIYASSPITTGYRMYKIFEKYKVKSVAELKELDKEVFKREIMDENISDGLEFKFELLDKNYKYIIAPGEFFAKGWTQEHYMSLWEKVIKKFSNIICFNDNYQYSNGCVGELIIGIKNNKQLRKREDFAIINPKEELNQIEKAIEHIDKIGADTKTLSNLYLELKDLN
ncbi:MAG: hypothetical protein PHQ66_02100 [Candidatus Nanoarchaeia archaeon]|nr:hypothetical protein [Candidatus Nanoarchaeia archaeon]MDD5357835.1 hypothetical protein [Candidatus Nanoarchaeia archaeon]MDD5588754.1 hypothetical protein [Candidatus Nanoarchaeia archaeon]